MAKYRVTSPDGSSWEVNAPDGTPDAEVMAYAKSQFEQQQKPVEPHKTVYATDEMSGPEKFLAGAGKAFVDLGRGVKQIGLESLGYGNRAKRYQQEIDASRQVDAPLMETGAGVAGNVAGGIASAAPFIAVPGANSVAGAAAMGGIQNALQPVATGESRLKNAAIGATTGAVAQYGLGKLAGAANQRLAGAQAKGAELATQNAAKDATVEAARGAGFVLPPSQVNPTILNRALEGYAGKLSTQQAASIKNQSVVDNLIKQDLGIPANKAVTPALLQGIRNEAGKAYEVVKQAGKIGADDEFVTAIRSLGGDDYAAVVNDLPEMANAEIGKLISALEKPEFNAQTAVSLIKKLRHEATVNFKNQLDPNKLELARAQRQAVDALESLVDRNLVARGMPEAVQQFREARTLIAKVHSAETALNEATGSFAASHFGKLAEKGKPLSGGMKTVGNVSHAFPKATQQINTSMPGVSPLDYAAVGGISAATGVPAFLSAIAGRPIARAAMLSKPYQGLLAGSPGYGPGLLTRGTPLALEELERLGLGGLLGPSIYAAQQ